MDAFFSNFSQLHFLRPECFYLLIPLALFWVLKMKVDDNTHWHQVIPAHLAKVLLTNEESKKKQNNWFIPSLWLIAITAMAGPTWQKIEKPVFQVKRASVIVMDMSMSMRATDVKPNRLAKAKYKAIDLANAIEDGEIALVAYAGDAFTISPLTPDSKNIVNLIPSLSPEIMPEQGSYPLLGLTKGSELLQQAGFVKGDIYWLTDGVEHEDIDELNKFISKTPYTINIMAFGTAEGAPIQMADKSLLKDHRGSIVIPKLNTQQLAQLATIGKGVFVKNTASDIDIKTLLSSHAIEQNAPEQEQQTDDKLLTGDDWQEAGPYLIILLLPFLLYAFRRGVTLSLFAVFLITNTPDVTAAESQAEPVQVTPTSWQDFVFNTKDQVATGDYQNGNYAQAQSTFENPQWKGSAAYKAGDFESALSYFEQDSSVKGLYNQGNALAQLGKLDEAIEAYSQALAQEPNHVEAKANKELIEMLKQQQEQEQQNQQQDQQQNQDQSQKEQQEGGQQQDQEQSDSSQSDSDQQNQDSQQQSDSQQQQGQSQSEPEPTAQGEDSEQQEGEDSEQQEGEEQGQKQESEQQGKEQDGEEQEAQQQSQQQSEAEGEEQGEQQAAQLTPEQLAEQEAQQKLEQLLRKVSDDPSVLLRNKMILESRKRQQFGRPPKGAVKSW